MELAQQKGNAALVVVDMHQHRFYPGGQPISEKCLKKYFQKERVAGRVCKAIRTAREIGMPVVLVRMESETIHPVIDSMAGEDSEFVRRIEKEDCDAFLGTGLEKLLGDWNVKNLIVCGYSWRVSKKGNACVASTVEGAKQRGFHVITAYPLMYGWTNGIGELARTIQHYRKATEHYFSEKRLFGRMLSLAYGGQEQNVPNGTQDF